MVRRAESHADMGANDNELWRRSSDRIRSSRGWSLRRLARLSRPGDTRWVWLAEGEPGRVIVKASENTFVAARAAWARDALAVLAARGHPVPTMLWHGLLDERWSLLVLERLPGRPLGNLDRPPLDALLALIEMQADAAFPGGWSVSEWIDLVLFEGWEHWWTDAEAVAPETSRRLQAFVEPARGYRLPLADLVHGDFNLTNVLATGSAITGVVDWDTLGCGSRATDLAGLLFDWHRLRLAGETVATNGEERLVRRILELAGDDGLRSTVTYGAIARLALSARRGERRALETWLRVTDAILNSVR